MCLEHFLAYPTLKHLEQQPKAPKNSHQYLDIMLNTINQHNEGTGSHEGEIQSSQDPPLPRSILSTLSSIGQVAMLL